MDLYRAVVFSQNIKLTVFETVYVQRAWKVCFLNEHSSRVVRKVNISSAKPTILDS